MLIIGVDSGLSGAIAFMHVNSTNKALDITVYVTPVIEVKKNNKKRREYVDTQIRDLIVDEMDAVVGPLSVCMVVEKVHAMPGNGIKQAFNFGVGYGLWRGLATGLNIPLHEVTPQAWKKEIMQGISDKDAARFKAQKLFPQLSHEFKLKKDDGKAEALLIAEYGRRVLRLV